MGTWSGLHIDKSRLCLNEFGIPDDGLDWGDTGCPLTLPAYKQQRNLKLTG